MSITANATPRDTSALRVWNIEEKFTPLRQQPFTYQYDLSKGETTLENPLTAQMSDHKKLLICIYYGLE